MLYGLAEARRLLHAGGDDAPLVVVEGYMDVIACQRAGVAAVAPMGTALTEEQMELLWRLHPEPTLCFDGDRAGCAAAFRAIDRALPVLKAPPQLRFRPGVGGKDPDEVLREQGAAALKARLADTTPFVDAAVRSRARRRDPRTRPNAAPASGSACAAAARAIADADLAAGLPRGACSGVSTPCSRPPRRAR